MKMPNFSIDEKSKIKLLKSIGLLVGLIIVFAILSRWMTSGSKTLAQYAADHPELAYGTTVPTNEDADYNSEKESSPNLEDTADDNSPSLTVSDNTAPSDTGAESDSSDIGTDGGCTIVTNGTSMIPERTEYETDFYYEPLSPELCDYITGISYPTEGSNEVAYDDLSYVHVMHYDFNSEICAGELICSNDIAQDLVEIFYSLYQAEYQIERMNLIDCYDGDDTASMEDNNTSCFNYRTVDDTNKLSKHALGLAIDINPFYNPYVRFTKEGGQIVSPTDSEEYADRSQSFPYKIDSDDLCYRLFTQYGFTWGGNWNSCKDYQHFQKNPK